MKRKSEVNLRDKLEKAAEQPSLQENDIRPDHLMAGQAKAYTQDIRNLLQFREKFVEVNCPACNENDAHREYDKFGLTYQRCSRCRTLFVNPRPPPDVLDTYYQNSENYRYWTDHIYPASEPVRREQIFRPRAERLGALCRQYGIPGGTFLEVGSGFGTFCEELRDLNLFSRIIAVEPTPQLAGKCRERGLEVIASPIETVEIQRGSVDVIASFEVIEHLFDPGAFLSKCSALLAPGGLLVMTCPNIDGFETVVLGSVSDTIDAEHLNYFNPISLCGLIRRHGFDVLEVTTPGKLDAELVRKKVLSGQFDITPQPFLRKILIDEWENLGREFQEFLERCGLSSHMWIVARKRPSRDIFPGKRIP